MTNIAMIHAQIDPALKEQAESILSRLGISPSNAIQMLYQQIVLEDGMPFADQEPVAIGGISRATLDALLQQGLDSLADGCYTVDEIDAQFAEEFGE